MERCYNASYMLAAANRVLVSVIFLGVFIFNSLRLNY